MNEKRWMAFEGEAFVWQPLQPCTTVLLDQDYYYVARGQKCSEGPLYTIRLHFGLLKPTSATIFNIYRSKRIRTNK